MKLSDKIRILRKARGLSQEQLGYSLSRVNKDGISRQTVSDWENGKFEPKLDNIRDLAEVLNVSFNALLDESVDLSDDKILYAVLNDSKVKSNNKLDKIQNNFSYRIYAFKRNKRHIVSIIVALISDALFVMGAIFFFKGVFANDTGLLTWIGLVIAIVSMSVGFALTIQFPYFIKRLIYGEKYTSFGTLTNSYLHINSAKETDNSIYIPIDKIEKMELGEKANKIHGPVHIKIKDRNKPLTLLDIKRPQKLIEIYNSLDSYIDNPDEIKIL